MDFNFKTNAIWKHKDVVGLDIGTYCIKAVQLKKKGKTVRLSGYGKMPVPENYVIEGIVTEPEKMAKDIKQFLEKSVWGQIDAPRVALSLSESQVFTKIITLPHTSPKGREDAVMWEATQSVPMAMTDLYVDWQMIGPNVNDPKQDDFIFTAAPKGIINSYLQLVNLLGKEIGSVETSLTAIARAMVPARSANEVLLVVDMGGQTTNLAIFDQFIRVTGSTLVGGTGITKKIAEALKVTEEEAENIKINPSEKQMPKIAEAIKGDLETVSGEIDRMIRYYHENNKDSKVSKVLLCGGSANISGLGKYFTDKLGLPTTIGNPWANISIYPIKPVPKAEASMYTNAIGLALMGVQDV
jgi:type IV pilus assembly protein PilM